MTNKPATVAQAACPFCKGRIAEDLLQFGGNCPHCLLEIPGEEAPTDPGLVARKKLEAEAALKAKAVRRTRIWQGLAASVVLLIGGSWAVWNAQQEREARTYELPDDLYLPPLQEAAAPGVNPSPTPTPASPKHAPAAPNQVAAGGAPATPAALSAFGPNTVSALGGMPVIPDATLQPVAAAPSPGLSGPRHASSGPTADLSISAPTHAGDMTPEIDDAPKVNLNGGALSDDDEIFAMIKEVMSRYGPQVRACYESRLKQDENLAGAWKVSFVVKKDGSTASVAVTPEGRKDSGLESCIASAIGEWKFSRITHDQPVSQTKRFGAY